MEFYQIYEINAWTFKKFNCHPALTDTVGEAKLPIEYNACNLRNYAEACQESNRQPEFGRVGYWIRNFI